MLFYRRRTSPASRSLGVHDHREEWGARILSLFGGAVDDPIKRCEAVLMHLPTLRHGGIQLRAMPELASAEVFRDFADALLDVILAEMQRTALRADSPQRHVYVRVLRVVMGCRHPFDLRAEVLLHSRDEIAGQPFQVGSVAELRRYDQLPEALIARFLPAFEPLPRCR